MNPPPVPDEHIRLWRGVACVHPNLEDVGEYWSVHRTEAEDYGAFDLEGEEAYSTVLFYLDVPVDLAFTWPDHDGNLGAKRACGEFVVPREWASKAHIDQP
jgi:hypothetical protein